MEIRTPKGHLFGMLDMHTYILTVAQGKKRWRMAVPKTGCELWYGNGEAADEKVVIPSQTRYLKEAV